jgi:hypothetical protein
MWWDELKSKLEKGACPDAQPSGFPGDKNEGFIKLGNTPRVDSAAKGMIRRVVPDESFSRF